MQKPQENYCRWVSVGSIVGAVGKRGLIHH